MSFISIYINRLEVFKNLGIIHIMALQTITKEEFSKKVENYVKNKNCSYMDAIITILEQHSFDFSIASKLLNQPLLEKLENEYRDLNYLPKVKNKLPFA